MKIENIKSLSVSQKKKLRINPDEPYYLVLPEKPQGGTEVDVITQSGHIIRKITLADAMRL